ncbi:hypothetical protein BYT27DRAFT_7252897 [Phlegmacium glaucopus]|nr:hypothetical protein BYT27DRAFT_7252897 [Phlegmacium glaucopus]
MATGRMLPIFKGAAITRDRVGVMIMHLKFKGRAAFLTNPVEHFPTSFSNSQPHQTHPTMTSHPKFSAVTNQEAMDKLLDNKKHCSSAQVQLEKQTATTTAASEVKKINLAAQKKQCITAFEDQLHKEVLKFGDW